MRKYLLLLTISILTFTFPLYSQSYTSNIRLLKEKEEQFVKLQEEFSIDSLTITSMIYGLERQIENIQIERDSVEEYLTSIKPQNHVYGIIKKDISIANREDQKDYIFDQGDTVQLINHSHHTYTLLSNNNQSLTINTKYIKPIEGRKKTTSLIAQYQIRLEDYKAIVEEYPTQEWYQFDIKRVQKEKEGYQQEYDRLVEELKILANEIDQLKKQINQKTTS